MIERFHRHMLQEPSWIENGLFAAGVILALIALSQ